jgi:hypothetical protein
MTWWNFVVSSGFHWPKRILIPLMLIIFFAFGCNESNNRPPEQLAYVKTFFPAQVEELQVSGKPGLCLEFMLIDAKGNPTASDGKVTVRVLKGPCQSHKFMVKHTDFRNKVYAARGAAYASVEKYHNPLSCLIGPLSLPHSSSSRILFEFERPDGQLFRREVHL